MSFTRKAILGCLIFTTLSVFSDSARILGLFPTPFKSHLIIHSAIADALVERGHDVTVVATLPKINKNSRYRYIQLDVKEYSPELLAESIRNPPNIFNRYTYFADEINRYQNESLNQPAMQKLMKEESFDLVIQGFQFNEFLLGVAAHFKCPVILSFMIRTFPRLNNLVGNPQEIAYVPSWMSGGRQPMGFIDRLKHFLCVTLMENSVVNYIEQSKQLYYYNANFPKEKYPSYKDMIKNISLVFTNHHFTQSPIRPDVPALIEIGGIQIQDKPDPLPEDLKAILDKSSKYGVIFFTLGSTVKTHKLDRSKMKIIFDVLSKLPQTVLWKWDGTDFPGESPNIIYRSWLPQNSVLAHSNVKLFVTHGGQGSVIESEYFGVPMVGIPMFSDQPANMLIVKELGFGLSVNYGTLTHQGLRSAIVEVLSNEKYANKVQQFAKLYKDRPMSAKQTVVYWVEYVLRHHGASHLQSPAVHMNYFQLLSLDVIGFLIVVLYIAYKVIKTVLLVIFRMFVRRKIKNE